MWRATSVVVLCETYQRRGGNIGDNARRYSRVSEQKYTHAYIVYVTMLYGTRVQRPILKIDEFARARKEGRKEPKRTMRVGLSRLRASRRCTAHVDVRRQHRNSGAAGINLCGATLSERALGPHPGVGRRYPRIGAPGETL